MTVVYRVDNVIILLWQFKVGLDKLYHEVFLHGVEYASFQVLKAD